jgi:hypothetical protein
MMRKILTFVIAFALLTSLLSPVFAKKDKPAKDNPSKKNVVVQQEQEEQGDEGDSEDEETLSPKEAAHKRNTVRKLNKIMEKTSDPEIEEEVEDIAEDQDLSDLRAEEAIEVIDQRPSYVKFLIGPDYKNLGQLRKEVVHVRNNIRKLDKLKEKAGEEEQGAIDEASDVLKAQSYSLQAAIWEKLSGFSLFGWLARWLSGFEPPEIPPDAEPTPTTTGMPEPTVDLTETPVASPSATITETPTVTEVPTASPTESL